MSLFYRQKWDIATLILEGNEYEVGRVRMCLIIAKVVLTVYQ